MQKYPMYIAGERREAAGGEWFETQYPYTGKTWALVARGGKPDVDLAVRAAHDAFTTGAWPKTTAAERGQLLSRLADIVDRNIEPLARAEMRDNGKTITEVRGQMRTLSPLLRYFGGLADKVEGKVIPADEHNFLTYTRYEPLGVVAAIVPWNSPLRLFTMKFGPAIAAGNTMVVKPSEYTSTSVLEFVSLVEEAGFPKGVLNVVTGIGAEVGQPLVEHPLVRKLSFTGGVEGGTKSYETAARGLRSAILELGGKSPNIVFADADLDAAAANAVAGVFGSTGQTCIAGSRLLAQDSIHDALLERIIAVAKKRKLGDPTDEATEVGPVATPAQFQKILDYIDIAKKEGAKLALGGKRASGPGLDEGLFIEPTIFVDVDNRMRIAQEEVFGPVLSVIRFKDEDEAVRIGNDVNFGLAAGVWTRDLRRAHRVAARLQAGTVWVNAYRKNAPQVPVGGYKNSGLGRENGSDILKDYMQVKAVWVNLS